MARAAAAKAVHTAPIPERNKKAEINDVAFGEWDKVIQPHQRKSRQQKRQQGLVQSQKGKPARVTHPAHAAKRKIALKNVMLVFVCFAMLVAMLLVYAKTVSSNLEKNELVDEIADMQAKIERLQMQINSSMDSVTIQERASEMGLGFPDNSQIRYINQD